MHVVVVGGANLDVKARSADRLVAGTSNPGRTVFAPGGVGRNVAENLARLGTPVTLVSAVGTDAAADLVVSATADAGVDVSRVRRVADGSGSYTAVLDVDGELAVAVSDMSAAESLTPDDVDAARTVVAAADLLVLDGNLAAATLARAMEVGEVSGTPVMLDPVSVPKAARLARLLGTHRLLGVTPSRDELAALGGEQALREHGVEIVWVRLGRDGSLLCTSDTRTELAAIPADVVDVTGAGDAMLAAFCHAYLGGATPVDAASYGHAAAALTVASNHTVRPDLTDELVRSLL